MLFRADFLLPNHHSKNCGRKNDLNLMELKKLWGLYWRLERARQFALTASDKYRKSGFKNLFTSLTELKKLQGPKMPHGDETIIHWPLLCVNPKPTGEPCFLPMADDRSLRDIIGRSPRNHLGINKGSCNSASLVSWRTSAPPDNPIEPENPQ